MQELEQVGIRLTRCAGGHLRRGQEKGAERSGTTVKPFDEATAQMAPALRVGLRQGARGVAALDRIADTLFARLLAFASPQPNAAASTWSQLALAHMSLPSPSLPRIAIL